MPSSVTCPSDLLNLSTVCHDHKNACFSQICHQKPGKAPRGCQGGSPSRCLGLMNMAAAGLGGHCEATLNSINKFIYIRNVHCSFIAQNEEFSRDISLVARC